MNKKMSKRQRDIKSKLMAAICMLLVSSIMMVSTTYAWFTLSTAPEVTGITTAVGANGNLEMALLPANQDLTKLDDPTDGIKSGSSDSMDAAGRLLKEANITWGNLVDLQDNNTYGLNNITLYPAALNGNGEKVEARPLTRPVYGADGRVAELKADTLTAGFSSGTFSAEGAYGVRAVGTASSMTARQLAHRTALSTAASATNSAKSIASAALTTHGNVLAGTAITHVGSASATHSRKEVETIETVVEELNKSLNQIETAIKWYIVAHNIAPNTVTDATYEAIQTAILETTLADLMAEGSTYAVPTGVSEAMTKLATARSSVSTALSTLSAQLTGENASKSEYAWGDFSGALSAIMDFDSMKLNGLAMNEVKQKDDAGNYVNASTIINAMGKEGLQLQMPSGSGVFADIADFCGTYSAGITFPEGTSVMGVGIGGVTATMVTNAPIANLYLTTIRTNTAPFAATEGGETTISITDHYGYIIDLAFRTNAAGSKLKLQADGIDRIYSENTANEDTMGGGSTMSFKSAAEGFNEGNVTALMSSLRVIFFETDTSNVLGHARLNPATASAASGEVTMKLAMWNPTGGTDGKGAFAENQEIAELTQNTAKAISVLVYLDGESVSNKDVAATGSQSMIGSMNLQFSSTANLVPMEYADLKNGKSDTTGPSMTTLNKVDVDEATAKLGVSVAKAVFTEASGNKTIGMVLNNVPSGSTVMASIGGTDISGTPATVSGMNGYIFAYSGELTADTEITVSVTAGSTNTNQSEGNA